MSTRRQVYDQTNSTRPAGVGKIVSYSKGRYEIDLANGRRIKNVAGTPNFQFPSESFATFNERGGNYQLLQPAPYGF